MKNKRKIFILLIILVIILIISLMIWNKNYKMKEKEAELGKFEYTQEYKDWLNLPEEERAKITMPRTVEIKDNGFAKKTNKRAENTPLPAYFNLKDKINIQVKNQGSTNVCWSFATLGALETNLQLRQGVSLDLSERHMEYATSNSFTTPNSKGANRQVNSGGNRRLAASYLSSGNGAILEEDMPFSTDFGIKDISYIQGKQTVTKVEDIVEFPAIKSNTAQTEKLNIMEKVKRHIINYGAVVASVNSDAMQQNSPNYNKDTYASYYNGEAYSNHDITIVGWDDNFSRTNFNQANMPTSDGAWIVRNSWGSSWADNGYCYVSYEDKLIGEKITGIQNSKNNIDYDNIYQHGQIGAYDDMHFSKEKVYGAEVFKKNTKEKEKITQVAVTLYQETYCKVYINPNGSDKSKENLMQATKDYILFPAGYHTINLDKPIEITKDEFTVVVEYYVPEGIATIPVESKDQIALLNNIEINKKQSFLLDELPKEDYSWIDLAIMNKRGTIKAFTIEEPKISATKYKVKKDCIYQIPINTSIQEFINNLDENAEVKVYNKDRQEENLYETMKTGMIIKINKQNEEIELVASVMGDIDGDGLVTASDLADTVKAVLESNNNLKEEQKKAIDMDEDSKITASDLADEVKLVLN